MRLLIKNNDHRHYAAHLPDADGNQLCGTPIKRANWTIMDIAPDGRLICRKCIHLSATHGSSAPERNS
jgi:hypothetical protein